MSPFGTVPPCRWPTNPSMLSAWRRRRRSSWEGAASPSAKCVPPSSGRRMGDYCCVGRISTNCPPALPDVAYDGPFAPSVPSYATSVRAGSRSRSSTSLPSSSSSFLPDSSPTQIWNDTWRGFSPGMDDATISGPSANPWLSWPLRWIPGNGGSSAMGDERTSRSRRRSRLRRPSRYSRRDGSGSHRDDQSHRPDLQRSVHGLHPHHRRRMLLPHGTGRDRRRGTDVPDLLMIEPSPAESSLFLYGSMNFAERIHSLNYGYNSSVYYFIENYDMLRECFARHGMEVSLERLTADRFLQQAAAPAARRRFGLTRQKSTASHSRGGR